MAAKPNVRYMATSTGKVHVVTNKREDDKHSKCVVVKKGHADGKWGRKKGVSADAALAMDECAKCGTHNTAKAELKVNKTPAQKKAERDEVIAKLGKASNKTKGKGKEPKRRGPKENRPETMKDKAEEHAKFAQQHGWRAAAEQTATNEWTVTATKGKQTLKIIWQDGRTIFSRVVLDNGVEVKLRNSSNWRKHAAGESKIKSDYRPRERGGKKAAKSEVISDDAPRKLPFSLDDDDDDIINALRGRKITWRVTMTKLLDTADVPIKSRNVRISTHPKSGRRMISFHELHSRETEEHNEVLGPERTVYLDKILKAR